jgi:ABC-2 type transport system ATP-binding protein
MPNGEAAPISTVGLTKRYRQVLALSDLSMEVRAGEVFGFLGLNGAGKTTTIRLLLDLIRPTAGRATVFGHDCRAESMTVRGSIGYLPGESSFYPDMTGVQLLRLLERVGGRPVSEAWRRQLAERFDLPPRDLSRRIRDYSTGMKRKLAIVQAIQHDPPLLILDEPTEGLDPLMQEAFYGLLRDLTARGRTVFLSSHVLSEVERVCDRVAVLRGGRLALLASIDGLRALAPRRVTVKFSADVPAPGDLGEGLALQEAASRRWLLEVRGPLGPLMARLAGLPVEDLDVRAPHLEDVVVRYYRGEA